MGDQCCQFSHTCRKKGLPVKIIMETADTTPLVWVNTSCFPLRLQFFFLNNHNNFLVLDVKLSGLCVCEGERERERENNHICESVSMCGGVEFNFKFVNYQNVWMFVLTLLQQLELSFMYTCAHKNDFNVRNEGSKMNKMRCKHKSRHNRPRSETQNILIFTEWQNSIPRTFR